MAADTGHFVGLSAGAAPKACRRMSVQRGPPLPAGNAQKKHPDSLYQGAVAGWLN